MAGASADQTDRTGMTPIEVIIRSQKLLEKSYYVSKTDKDLCSKVSILLEHGANPNIKESDQDSFLILAAERLLPLVVSKLLKYGANVNHTGQCKRTALHKVLLAGKYNLKVLANCLLCASLYTYRVALTNLLFFTILIHLTRKLAVNIY